MPKKSVLIETFLPYYLLGIIFGYPILTVITLFLGIQSTALSITYRFVFLALGVFLIGASIMANRGLRFVKSGLPFLFFWMLYGVILINDISIEGIRMGNRPPAYLYSFAFGSSMMSYVTVFVCGRFMVFDDKFLNKILKTVVFANVIIALYLLKTGGLSVEALAYRASIDTETGNVLNPITIGQYGVFGMIVSTVYLLFAKKKTAFLRILSLGGIGLGIGNTLLGASRGPILVGAILLLLTVYFFYSYRRLTRALIVKSWAVFLSLIAGFLVFVIPFLSSINISVFQRLGKMFEQKSRGEKEIRDYEWESAIRQFLDHPVLGDKYINDFDNFYPHNVYLEVLMSTGIVGGVMFFTGLSVVFFNAFIVFHSKSAVRYTVVIIVIAILLFRVTSGALHQAADFWAALALITCCGISSFSRSRPTKFSVVADHNSN